MNLYGQSQLAKHLNDQKNIERNYWRIFRELDDANKLIVKLESDNVKMKEEIKKLKAAKPVSTTKKKPTKLKVLEDTE